MKILITAPSLDENQNVSGISTIVRQIVRYGSLDYEHFAAGRRDTEKANALWLAKQMALPFRFFERCRTGRPHVVHVNTALNPLSIWRDAALTWAARAAGRRVVVSIHGGKFLLEPFTDKRLESVALSMLRRASAVVVYSELEKEQILGRWPALPIRVLGNAIPFAEVPKVARNNAEPLLIFLGRFHESKGLQETIDAARILSNEGYRFRFDAYGEGPQREAFLSGMRSALGDRFHYGGIVAGDEKWQRLAAADIFVLPSRYGEGLPMAMLEAMAVGCVVVVADVASVITVVTDGVNGYVVEPKRADQLVSRLRRLLEDRDGWAQVQQNAIATIRDDCAIADYMRALEGIYAAAA